MSRQEERNMSLSLQHSRRWKENKPAQEKNKNSVSLQAGLTLIKHKSRNLVSRLQFVQAKFS